MRILQDKNKQRSFTNIYWKLGRKVLLKSIQPVLARAEHLTPEDLKQHTRRLLRSDDVEGYIETLWTHTGSTFADYTSKRLLTKKDTQLDFWERLYRKYAAQRSAKVLGLLLDTEAENINRIIDIYITEGNATGQSIQTISNHMRANLERDLIEMQRYEAERIARTEVIGASNQGSFEGAKSTGLDIGKFWMTSGLPGVRETHLQYEGEGIVDMEYDYAEGLQFPGDANCQDAGDVINCRCTIGYDDKN